ncbi:MAG: Hsp20/alpha crystallin family protein [Verrucomicrobiota bacterium]
MNPLTRWDPFKEIDEMNRRLTQAFGLAPARMPVPEKESMSIAQWAPSVDISETDKEWLVKADLPEVKKEDVKVTVEDGVLSITGERKFEKEVKDKKYHRIERSYGNFVRSFTLPDHADPARVAAEFKDGVLTVKLPKTERALSKTVDVRIG